MAKLTFFAALLLSAVLAISYKDVRVSAAVQSHNFTMGTRIPGDRLVLEQSVEKRSSLWQITSVVLTFNATRYTRITKVEAEDTRKDGTGAYVTHQKGGPGSQNVTLKFKSQRNHGIHFRVRLFAR